MKSLKNIMREYQIENLLVPKINQLLNKKKLTFKEQELLDKMLDRFFEIRYPMDEE